MALVADYTRVEQRAKASAIIGGSIAIAFGLALVLGPTFANFGGLQAVFAATGVLALAGMGVVALLPKPQRFQRAHSPRRVLVFNRSRLSDVLSIKSLNTMYLSIFFLHFLLMAVFVVVPSSLETQANISREHHAWVLFGGAGSSSPWNLLVDSRTPLHEYAHPDLTDVLGCLVGGPDIAGDWRSTGHTLWFVAVFYRIYGARGHVAVARVNLRTSRLSRNGNGCLCLFAI